MRTITLEEHFVTDDFLKATGAYGDNAPEGLRAMRDRLLDIGEGRIAAMDEGGVDVQVLSLAATGIDDLAVDDEAVVLRSVHDELAAAIAAHPTRLAGFATSGLKNPRHAVQEIERCITRLGFRGVIHDGTTDGRFLDAPEFFPVLEAIAALDVPLYIHPAPPPRAVFDAYYAGLPGDTGHLLSIAGWGWHSETAIQLLRLVLAGVFDRLPTLRVIVGHMGEGLPFAMARTNAVFSRATHLERGVQQTLLDQVFITSSGYFTQPPFDCARAIFGIERMMYSVDYPFSPTTRGQAYLASLPLTEADRALFAHATAERVLKLPRAD
jgi:predicted TIM-barrel fold metal-dependent hydrolase